MTGNTFGRLFRLTTYGESHGPGLGGVVDGCPAGLALCENDLQAELDARRPGAGGKGGAAGTARNEPDRVRIVSGVFEGLTTGTPIAFHVENTDQRSRDYGELARQLRPGHADLGFLCKYGRRDYRGGGRSSGRETLSRVAGGAIAAKFLATLGIRVSACTLEVGGLAASLTASPTTGPDALEGAATRPWFSPDDASPALWEALAAEARKKGDTLGGLVRVAIHGLPAGLGEPVFDKLDARLAYAMMGVGAVKGVEIGRGFAAARLRGSENNDPMLTAEAAAGHDAAQGASRYRSRGQDAALNPECPAPGSDQGRVERFASTPGDRIRSEGDLAGCLAAGVLPSGAGFGFASNNAGGVLGGISSGAPVVITVAIKPIASISLEQQSIDTEGRAARVRVGGRHDICAIPRVVPVLKAMAALCAADFVLLQRAARMD